MKFSAALLVSTLYTVVNAAPTRTIEANDIFARADPGVVQGPGLKWYNANLSAGTGGLANSGQYTCYSGPASNFPGIRKWMNFNAAWNFQRNIMDTYTDDTAQQLTYMHDAIVAISKNSMVDARVILAVIMQESGGKVNVPCTNSSEGVHNCGLMQAYNSHAYNPATPKKSITLMIQEGTQGTANGPGLAQDFNQAKSNGNVYNVLRIYNSGIAAFDPSNLNNGNGATNTYVTDIANRLMGWDGSDPQGKRKACAAAAQPTTAPTPTPTPTGTPASSCGPSKYVAPPSMAAGNNQRCCSWYAVQSGDNCDMISRAYNITLNQFYTWNPEVNNTCGNLWAGSQYCVSSDQAVSS